MPRLVIFGYEGGEGGGVIIGRYVASLTKAGVNGVGGLERVGHIAMLAFRKAANFSVLCRVCLI